MANEHDAAAAEIIAQVRALGGEITEDVSANLDALVDAKVAASLSARNYQPAGGPMASALEGTKYGRHGMTEADVQMMHGVLRSGKDLGWSKRGPSEELTNLVEAIQSRVCADEGIDRRAMDTADTTALIGNTYVSQVWEAAMPDAKVAPLIRAFPMTDATGYIPVFGAPPVPLLYPQNTQDDSADYATQDTTFQRVSVTASKFGLHQKWSGELEEQSIIPFMAAIRQRQTQAIAFYGDDIIVNADTTMTATGNINSDDAAPSVTDRRTGFDGIRHAALVDNTANATDASGTLTYAMLTGLRAKCVDRARMTDWSHPVRVEDFVYIVNSEGEPVIGNLDEVVTVDKYGPSATVLQGEVARIGRNPLIATFAMPLTESDGKANVATGTKNQVAAFNVNAYSIGYLRNMTVETYRRAERDQSGIVLFWSMGLARYTPTGAASGIEHTGVVYNW